MALLTAEDVLNKAFSKTKYREGFDQDEVDDFLDEVANTIAQLTSERDELAARIAGGAGAPVVPPAAEAPPVTSAGGVPGTTGLLAAATEPGAVNPTGMLAMAQKLHDEYVQAGEAERDRIIEEAHGAADQIRERADEDAKTRMDELAGERVELEGRIDDLRRFERDYRARLKQYLENLLGDLDHSGVAGAAGLAAGAAVVAEGFGDDAADDSAAPADEAAVEAPVEAEEVAADFAAESVAEDAVADDVAEDGTAEVVAAEPEVAWGAPAAGSWGGVDAAAAEEPAAVSDEEPAVSFEEAIGVFAPAQEETGAADEEPQGYQPPAPPAYDATQSWESQLRPQGETSYANPFAPVTEAATGDQGIAVEGEVPTVEAADEEGEQAPYTPPSSRMFTDLYGQQRPEGQN